jgi:hypothetical protein
MWGLAPLAFWWLDAATVYALGLVLIASVYIGFAVADGRPRVVATESGIAAAFVVVAAAAVTGSPWLLVAGLVAHGVKDLWQHRSQFVANTMVAAVLPRGRLDSRGDHRRRDHRRRSVPQLTVILQSPDRCPCQEQIRSDRGDAGASVLIVAVAHGPKRAVARWVEPSACAAVSDPV